MKSGCIIANEDSAENSWSAEGLRKFPNQESECQSGVSNIVYPYPCLVRGSTMKGRCLVRYTRMKLVWNSYETPDTWIPSFIRVSYEYNTSMRVEPSTGHQYAMAKAWWWLWTRNRKCISALLIPCRYGSATENRTQLLQIRTGTEARTAIFSQMPINYCRLQLADYHLYKIKFLKKYGSSTINDCSPR